MRTGMDGEVIVDRKDIDDVRVFENYGSYSVVVYLKKGESFVIKGTLTTYDKADNKEYGNSAFEALLNEIYDNY